jgi:DNA-directed RNA polymerase subunit RPC12/RpoP
MGSNHSNYVMLTACTYMVAEEGSKMRCLRCGKEFDNPYPEIKIKDRNTEIACKEWCAKCNELVMHVLYRGRSAYQSPKLSKGKE